MPMLYPPRSLPVPLCLYGETFFDGFQVGLLRGVVVNLSAVLDLGRWFDPFPGPSSPLHLLALVSFAIWTIASIGVYRFRRRIFVGRGAIIAVVTRFGPYAILIGGIGLFLLGARYASVPYLSIRFFFYLTILAALGFVGFLAYYRARRYPAFAARIRAAELKRRYEPPRKKKKRPTRT